MRIQIEMPEEFEEDYRKDRFRDFFERVRADIDYRGLCGNYERETAGMFIDAFQDSRCVDYERTHRRAEPTKERGLR